MEGLPARHGGATQQASSALESILEEAFAEIKTRRLNHIVAHEMPEDYLKYIGNVSMLLHSHREPAATRALHKAITEPPEAPSHQLHRPPPSRRLHHRPFEEDLPPPPPPPAEGRKQSVCLSHRSRASIERLPSRKNINSRRKIFDTNRLIPLNRATEHEERDGLYEEKITQLRKRKVKLEEAMRAFREEDRSERVAEYKKTKENQALFTTDFRGKVINFNPRAAKSRPNESVAFSFKFQTLVESGRSWGNWGKVSSSTRRNLFRENAVERASSEAELA